MEGVSGRGFRGLIEVEVPGLDFRVIRKEDVLGAGVLSMTRVMWSVGFIVGESLGMVPRGLWHLLLSVFLCNCVGAVALVFERGIPSLVPGLFVLREGAGRGGSPSFPTPRGLRRPPCWPPWAAAVEVEIPEGHKCRAW